MNLEEYIGKKHSITKVVMEGETAKSFGSGDIDVFSTPNMIGLMENVALNLIQSVLDEGYTTVGTKVDVVHLAATPIGMEVGAEAELVEVDRKRLVFKVKAWDECGIIGKGIHERFVVNTEEFMSKAADKSTS